MNEREPTLPPAVSKTAPDAEYEESTGGVEVFEYDALTGEWVKSR